MKTTVKTRIQPFRLIASVVLIALSSLTVVFADQNKSAYAFYRSDKGSTYKRMVHSIFGFAIDMPNDWIFGVNGAPPTAIVLLYPEKQNPSLLTNVYEAIELGEVAPRGSNLDQSVVNIQTGMRLKHRSISQIGTVVSEKINGMPARTWSFDWDSKTGLKVHQTVVVIETPYGIRSIATITTRSDYLDRQLFYRQIAESYKASSPKL